MKTVKSDFLFLVFFLFLHFQFFCIRANTNHYLPTSVPGAYGPTAGTEALAHSLLTSINLRLYMGGITCLLALLSVDGYQIYDLSG